MKTVSTFLVLLLATPIVGHAGEALTITDAYMVHVPRWTFNGFQFQGNPNDLREGFRPKEIPTVGECFVFQATEVERKTTETDDDVKVRMNPKKVECGPISGTITLPTASPLHQEGCDTKNLYIPGITPRTFPDPR